MPQIQLLAAAVPETFPPVRSVGTKLSLTRKRVRYANFASVYFLQGWIPGFSLTALFNYMSGHGVSASRLGVYFGIVGLPWAFQFLWGPIVDQFTFLGMDRHRFWIWLSSICALTILTALMFVGDPVAHVYLVGAILVAHSVFASLLDTAVDAQIIIYTPEAQRGRMSAITRGSFVLGGALGAAFFAFTLKNFGFSASVLLLLITAALFNTPALLINDASAAEPAPERLGTRSSMRRFFLKLAALMRTPSSLLFLVLCFGLQFLLAVTNLNIAVDLVQSFGWDPARLSQLQATCALVTGTVGVAIMGFVADRFGHRRVLGWTMLSIAAAFFLFYVMLDYRVLALPLIVLFTGLVPDLLGVVFTPVLMEVSYRATVATQFAVFMAITNFGDILGVGSSHAVQSVLPLRALCVIIGFFFAASALALRRVR